MISFLLTSSLRIFRTFEFFSGKTNIRLVLRKKNLLFLLTVNLIVFGCCSCVSTSPADFGCKGAAIYGNYDSCVRRITKSLYDPAVRAKLEETPEQAAYYHQMLAVAELHRGNIPEAMTSFERSIQFKSRPTSEAHDKMLKMSQKKHAMTRLAWLKKDLARNRNLPPDVPAYNPKQYRKIQ